MSLVAFVIMLTVVAFAHVNITSSFFYSTLFGLSRTLVTLVKKNPPLPTRPFLFPLLTTGTRKSMRRIAKTKYRTRPT